MFTSDTVTLTDGKKIHLKLSTREKKDDIYFSDSKIYNIIQSASKYSTCFHI